jgi:hypothetical protein
LWRKTQTAVQDNGVGFGNHAKWLNFYQQAAGWALLQVVGCGVKRVKNFVFANGKRTLGQWYDSHNDQFSLNNKKIAFDKLTQYHLPIGVQTPQNS